MLRDSLRSFARSGASGAKRALIALPIVTSVVALAPAAGAAVVVSSAPGRVGVDISPPGGPSEVEAVAALKDGSTLAAVRNRERRRLLRIRADGRLDDGFGRGGLVRVGSGEVIELFALRSGGALVVSDPRGATAPQVRRFTPSGRRDTGFGQGGRIVLRSFRSIETVDRTEDDVLLLGGRLRRITDESKAGLLRLTASGRLDGLGSSGLRRLDNRQGIAQLAARADGGALMLLAPPITGGSGRKRISRMTPNGRFKPFAALYPFDANGTIRMPGRLRTIAAIRADSRDRVLVLAEHADGSQYLLRLLPTGTLDPSFGTDGHVEIGLSSVDAFHVLPDDRVLLAVANGEAAPGASLQVVHLTAEGRVERQTTAPLPVGGGDDDALAVQLADGSFEWQRRSMAPLGGNLYPSGSAARPDGSLIIGGGVELSSYRDDDPLPRSAALLVAVAPDGQLDGRFGVPRSLGLSLRGPDQDYSSKGLLVRLLPRRQGTARVLVFRGETAVAERMVHFVRRKAIQLRIPWTAAGAEIANERADIDLRVEVEANDIAGNRVTRTAQVTVR